MDRPSGSLTTLSLIHEASSQQRPVVITIFTQVVRTYIFPNFQNAKHISSENSGGDVDLAEGIIQ